MSFKATYQEGAAVIEYTSPVHLDETCRDVGEACQRFLRVAEGVFKPEEKTRLVPTISAIEDEPGLPYYERNSIHQFRLWKDGGRGFVHVVTWEDMHLGNPNPRFVVYSPKTELSKSFLVDIIGNRSAFDWARVLKEYLPALPK